MASRLFFNGQSYSTPTAVSAVDDTAEAPTNLTVGNVLALVGTCDGGRPGTVFSFGDPDEVATALTSGPLCVAAIKAFAPSTQTNAPGLVKCIRVGTATPSTLTLADVRGDPSIIVTDQEYGTTGAIPSLKVEPGTNAGTLRITVQSGQNYAVGDNLGGALFSVNYAGALAGVLITCSATSISLQVPTGTQYATLQLTPFSVVQDIVNFLNGVVGFVATATPGMGQKLVQGQLDLVSYSVKSVTPIPVYANVAAVLAWLNGPAQPYVAAVAAAPTAGLLQPPVPVGWMYLSGGTDPTIQLADWINALTILQGEDVQWVVPLTGDPSVHAAVDAHVQYMSTVGQKERRALVGPVAGTTQTQAMALPVALNSDRTSVVWPGFYDFDSLGNLVLLDPINTAAATAAGFAGSDPGEPMTNKAFSFRGLEQRIRNPTDTDQLIQAGVLCFDQEQTGFMCVRSISSWLVNDNFNRVEVSTGAATDFAVRNVRQALSKLKGQRGDPRIIGRAITTTESALMLLAQPPPQGPGVIVGDANSPAFYGIKASLVGDVLSVSWNMSPVIPVNFIPCSVSITPYSGTASA